MPEPTPSQLKIDGTRYRKDSPIKAGLKRIWKWLVKKFTKNHIIEGPYDN